MKKIIFVVTAALFGTMAYAAIGLALWSVS
jgi:hypothetical protein